MIEHIPADWREAVADTISSSRFAHLTEFVAAERARTDTAVCGWIIVLVACGSGFAQRFSAIQ
jgi:hypothetical protein